MPFPRRLSPAVLAALVVAFLLLRAGLFAFTTASEYVLYLDYARESRAHSLAELHHSRDIEYPPLATLFGVAVLHVSESLPAGTEILTVWRPEEPRGTDCTHYEVALGLVLFAIDLACMALVYFVARRVYPDDNLSMRVGRLAVYVAATTAIGLILYDRQDLVVGFIAITALAAFARGWSVVAYAILAAGVAYKLVPVLLLPLFVIGTAAMRPGPRTVSRFFRAVVWQAAIAGAILALVPILMYALCGGERAFVFLSFHSVRGLQVEASPAWAVLLIDPSTALGHSHGSYTLRGTLADRIAKASTIATIAVLCLSTLISLRGFWFATKRNQLVTHIAASSLLVWLGFILCGKVGSPQYPLWLAPLLPLLPLRGNDRWWVALLIVGMMLTTAIYPCTYFDDIRGANIDDHTWVGPSAIGLVLLAVKSVIYAIAFVWLAVIVWRANWCFLPSPLAAEGRLEPEAT